MNNPVFQFTAVVMLLIMSFIVGVTMVISSIGYNLVNLFNLVGL